MLLYINHSLFLFESFTNHSKKNNSAEPESNQRPEDIQQNDYSPPLYQLSYQQAISVEYYNFYIFTQNCYVLYNNTGIQYYYIL